MAKLYDYRGEPVEMSMLTKELATVSLAGVRTVWHPSAVLGLTPEKLAGILSQVDQHDAQAYLTLAMEMEEREPHYAAQLATRTLAVKKLELSVEAADDSAAAEEDADLVRAVLRGSLKNDLIAGMMDAVGKGFSITEIMWDRSGREWFPERFEWRDPRSFVFDRETGNVVRMRDITNTTDGLELAPFKFVQHRPKIKMGLPLKTGLARLCAVAFMCKSYALKDWLAFAEVFGMPLRVGKYQEGATREEKQKLLTAVSSIGTDAACIISENMMIEFIEANRDTNGADKLFQGLAEWLDAQVSKAVLGQTMTADNGSSLSQAKVHNEVRLDILAHDAETVAATIDRDVVKPLIDLNRGVRPRNGYPCVKLQYEPPEDLVSLSKSLPPFIELGLRVEESVIRDKFGLPEPAEGAPILAAPAKAAATPPGEQPEPTEMEDDDDEEEVDEDIDAARRKIEVALLRKVMRGEPLTTDQRALLVHARQGSAMAARQGEDEVDRINDAELIDVNALMQPLVGPIEELVARSSSYEEVAKGLENLVGELGLTDLIRSLATAAFKARGLGDATDEVQ